MMLRIAIQESNKAISIKMREIDHTMDHPIVFQLIFKETTLEFQHNHKPLEKQIGLTKSKLSN